MGGMNDKRQFSLGYPFLETFWIALAIATTRAAVLEWKTDWGERDTSALAFLVPLAILF